MRQIVTFTHAKLTNISKQGTDKIRSQVGGGFKNYTQDPSEQYERTRDLLQEQERMKVEQEAFERDQVSESTNQTKKEMKRKENAAKKQRKELQDEKRNLKDLLINYKKP